jgi:hypothetical protein
MDRERRRAPEIQRGAREEARRLSGLADSGIDPRNERAAVVAATEAERLERARAGVTLGDVWAAYVAARSGDWSDGYKRDHEQVMAAPGRTVGRRKRKSKGGPLYPLQAERLEALTPARLERWLENERKTRPAFAARAFRLLRACLRWAEGRPEYAGLAEPGRVLSRDVRRKVPKVGTRDDCLQREQLPAWFEAVRAIADPVKAAYLQGLLLTGARREELAGLRWEDCDFQWGALTMRDKVEGQRVIPCPLPGRTAGRPAPPHPGEREAEPVGIFEPDHQARAHARGEQRAYPRRGCCRAAAPDPARAAPELRHPERVDGNPRGRGGADSRPQAERHCGESTTAAGRWTCCGSGIPNWKRGF